MRCDPYKKVGYFFDRGGFILVREIEIMLFKGLFINFKGISFHDGIFLKGFVAFVAPVRNVSGFSIWSAKFVQTNQQ